MDQEARHWKENGNETIEKRGKFSVLHNDQISGQRAMARKSDFMDLRKVEGREDVLFMKITN